MEKQLIVSVGVWNMIVVGFSVSCLPEVETEGETPLGSLTVTSFCGSIQQIQLWDTAGQERFRKSMVQHYYRNVHAVVFVYDVTNAASFRSLPAWIEECKQHALGTEVPRILVGNKCDLQDSIQVGTEVAQQFADTHSMPLFETSAKNSSIQKDGTLGRGSSDHVEAIFMTVAHKLRSQKPLVLSQPADGPGGTVSLSSRGDSKADGTRSWGCSSC